MQLLGTPTKGKPKNSLVYKGIDIKNNQEVVIKVLHPHFSKSEVVRKRFFNETTYQLNIPGLISHIDFGTESEPFLVFPFFNGKNIYHVNKGFYVSNQKQLKNVINISIQILETLKVLHQNGIIHCDIKPGNILFSKEKSELNAKLLDLGQSHQIGSDNALPDSFSMIYSPPEFVLKYRPLIGAHSDLYSLALCIYELLTHQQPFKQCNSLAIINLMLNYPIQKQRNIPNDLFLILSKATFRIPFKKPPHNCSKQEIIENLQAGVQKRYKNADEMLQDMLKFKQGIEKIK